MAKEVDVNELIFLNKEKIDSVLEAIKNETGEGSDTVQVQINLKGLDPRRDNKVTKDITMPHKARNSNKVAVLADKDMAAKCEEKSIPYVLIDSLGQDSMRKEKEIILKRNKYFILSPGYNKVIQLKNILRSGKTPYQVKPQDNIADIYDNAQRTFKLRIKDMSVTSFTAGHTKMNNDEIFENIKHAFTVILSALKKGDENIKDVFIKGAQSEPKKIY